MQINIPTEKRQDIIDAFCSVYKYRDEVEDVDEIMIPNPQTKAEFASQQLLLYIREVYKSYKVDSIDAAKQTIITNADIYTNDITSV